MIPVDSGQGCRATLGRIHYTTEARKMATIIVENDGPIIVNTNYWESEHATAGYAYLTINAGCYRLLMPPGQDQLIQEITTTGVTAVVISRGKWTDQGNRDALEIMFEDGTKSPIALHMSLESVDRLPD